MIYVCDRILPYSRRRLQIRVVLRTGTGFLAKYPHFVDTFIDAVDYLRSIYPKYEKYEL